MQIISNLGWRMLEDCAAVLNICASLMRQACRASSSYCCYYYVIQKPRKD